jgi:hypothetical protein
MRIEQKGVAITSGTSDAPAPKDQVPAAKPVPVMAYVESVAEKSAAPTESLSLTYRVNGGALQTVSAEPMWKSPRGKGFYFRAYIPPQNPGDRIDYTFGLGGEVDNPTFTVAGTFGSFVVASSGAKPPASSPPEGVVKPVVGAALKAEASIPVPVASPTQSSVVEGPFKSAVTETTASPLSMSGGPASATTPSQSKGPIAPPPKASFAETVGAWAENHASIVKAVTSQPNVASLRDVALQFDTEKLAALVDPASVPAATPGTTPEEKKQNFATSLQRKLFAAQPSAVLQRMVQNAEIPIADSNVRAGVATFLSSHPDFQIGTTSVYTALKSPDALKDVPEQHRTGVVDQLKTLQRVQALSPAPEAIPLLLKANLTSAFQVGEMPESTFLTAHGKTLGEDTARQVYTHAINTRIRNENALMTMRESIKGTGLAIIDGETSLAARLTSMQAVADQYTPLNLQTLFGSLDSCECDDCLSVYSPASYFVELLQFLRNNNLDPNNANTGQEGIANTPLEKLFRRRPDLGCLELTCENTFTVLPYVDLVNEVMESFIVHLGLYQGDTHTPKQATLDVFNVADETTSELLAQPQHINYDAYQILKDAVYPFTLPYHQPIDVARIILNYLGTSRYELLDTCRSWADTAPKEPKPAEEALNDETFDRAADAEFLGLTQEEYVILAKEAFRSNKYYKIVLRTTLTDDQYRERIGVKPVHEYYGPYTKESDMLSLDEDPTTGQKGLTFVKAQFLPRTGIQYVDLVNLLKTQFINPLFPQGQALTILESIRFSYRFLQTLVDSTSANPGVRFARLINYLLKAWRLAARPDPCYPEESTPWPDTKALQQWVYCYFESIGTLIVLETGEGSRMPVSGRVVSNGKSVGLLLEDGTINDSSGTMRIGQITASGVAVAAKGKSFLERNPDAQIVDASATVVGRISQHGLLDPKGELLPFLPPNDTCDLEKVRLVHLDGTPVTVDEYDRMQRFIRLWRKLGWTIDDTDKALSGLALDTNTAGSGQSNAEIQSRTHLEVGPNYGSDPMCPTANRLQVHTKITPDFLHQLVAVRKLLERTGLPLPKLLAFWSDISTSGETSLYSSLFLKHNVVGIDQVFAPDIHGNYLTQLAKITDHVPVLMAALKLKADDVTAIMGFTPGLADELTLSNVSALYRYALLSKILHLKVPALAEVIALFDNPFTSADRTLAFLDDWGRMEDAGFTFDQLNYVIRDQDSPSHPLAPTEKKILQIAKTLYDGLNQIDTDNPDAIDEADATSDLVRAKTGMLFEAAVVEQIVGLLEGTTVYTTNAPRDLMITMAEGLPITVDDPQSTLAIKLKYINLKNATPPSASLQVIGILTDKEKQLAVTLSNDSGWLNALDRMGKKARQFFNDSLVAIFPAPVEAATSLLAGDVNVPPNPDHPLATDKNTASGKRFYFLEYFMPFLRQQLRHQLIVGSMSGASGLGNDVTDALLSDILYVGASELSAVSVLEAIHQKPAASGPDWTGYLIPTADGSYTFVTESADDSQPPDMVIDGRSIAFAVQQEDPTNFWATDPRATNPPDPTVGPIILKRGTLYCLQVTGRSAGALSWKTPALPKALIPASALLPDYSSSGTEEVFVKLAKAALLIKGFGLSVEEVGYWQTHGQDFAVKDDLTESPRNFDWNSITRGHWLRLQAYTNLRDKLPKTETSLLDLFTWPENPIIPFSVTTLPPQPIGTRTISASFYRLPISI